MAGWPCWSACIKQGLELLLPHLVSTRVKSVQVEQGTVVSGRTHGGYRRRLADLPIAGRPVRIEVGVRRFRCGSSGCDAATFAEQIPDLTTPFARRTAGLTEQIAAIGLALAGRAGSRLAAKLGMRAHCTEL